MGRGGHRLADSKRVQLEQRCGLTLKSAFHSNGVWATGVTDAGEDVLIDWQTGSCRLQEGQDWTVGLRLARAWSRVVFDCSCPDLYFCNDDIECPRHGGFDTCCSNGRWHRPARDPFETDRVDSLPQDWSPDDGTGDPESFIQRECGVQHVKFGYGRTIPRPADNGLVLVKFRDDAGESWVYPANLTKIWG